jgi:hypothetical protein
MLWYEWEPADVEQQDLYSLTCVPHFYCYYRENELFSLWLHPLDKPTHCPLRHKDPSIWEQTDKLINPNVHNLKPQEEGRLSKKQKETSWRGDSESTSWHVRGAVIEESIWRHWRKQRLRDRVKVEAADHTKSIIPFALRTVIPRTDSYRRQFPASSEWKWRSVSQDFTVSTFSFLS